MYPDVDSLVGELVTIGEVWVNMKDTQPPWRITFFSLILLHEVGAQSLMVDLKAGLQTLTKCPHGESQADSSEQP
jgi:hypothetical protein